jgi:hypothetical protein
MELLQFLKGLSPTIREIPIFKTMGWCFSFLSPFLSPFLSSEKQTPLSRCRTEVSVASDVAVRGQLRSKVSSTMAPLNSFARGRTFPDEIPVFLAFMCGKKANPLQLEERLFLLPTLCL